MKIEIITVGLLKVNCYIISGENGQSLVIDPGADTETILRFLSDHQLGVSVYLITHGHPDHIGALASIAKKQPAPIAMHPADSKWAFSPANQIPGIYDIPERPAEIARSLDDGQQWTDAGLTYKIIATPGHSAGSVCFYFPDEQVLFAGDTLFQGSVGRTDVPGGDMLILEQSLKKIACLPGKTRIFPGHGPATTLDTELQSNPYLINIGLKLTDFSQPT